MLATQVTYRVHPAFVTTNQANIGAVMAELAALGDVGVQYTAFLRPDGVTFVHLVVARDEAAMKIVPNLADFRVFREALRTGAESPPENESWSVVGANRAV